MNGLSWQSTDRRQVPPDTKTPTRLAMEVRPGDAIYDTLAKAWRGVKAVVRTGEGGIDARLEFEDGGAAVFMAQAELEWSDTGLLGWSTVIASVMAAEMA